MQHCLCVENAIGGVSHSQAKLHALVALVKQKEQRLIVEPDSGSDNSFVVAEAALHCNLDVHRKSVAHHTGCAGNPVLDTLDCRSDQRNLANLNIVLDSVVAVALAAEQELVEKLVAALEAVKPQEPELAVLELPLALVDSQAEQHSELEPVLELLPLG